MTENGLDAVQFAKAFGDFLDTFQDALPPPSSTLHGLIAAHLGHDPGGSPCFTERFHVSEHPNVQLAMNALLERHPGWDLLGLPSELHHYGGFGSLCVSKL